MLIEYIRIIELIPRKNGVNRIGLEGVNIQDLFIEHGSYVHSQRFYPGLYRFNFDGTILRLSKDVLDRGNRIEITVWPEFGPPITVEMDVALYRQNTEGDAGFDLSTGSTRLLE